MQNKNSMKTVLPIALIALLAGNLPAPALTDSRPVHCVLELVVYDSGPNGCIAFFKIDAETSPAMFAWQYTGNE